jgi:hypothetical protein
MKKVMCFVIIIETLSFGCASYDVSIPESENKIPLYIVLGYSDSPYNMLDTSDYAALTLIETTKTVFRKNLSKIFTDVSYVSNGQLPTHGYDLLLQIKITDASIQTQEDADIRRWRESNPLYRDFPQRYGYVAKVVFEVVIKDSTGNTLEIFTDSVEGSSPTDCFNNLDTLHIRKICEDKAFLNSVRWTYKKISDNILASQKIQNIVQHKIEQKTLPANLFATLHYSDQNSFFPNSTIDAGEKSVIRADITNNGEGTAFDVKFLTESDYSGIDFPKVIIVGDIQPGETKTVEINLQAGLKITDGVASFSIHTQEKRGYDAPPVEIKIPVRRLEEPKLAITRIELNDATLGQAKGNNNGKPENGETIELIAYIQNTGVGPAFGSMLKLVESSKGVNVLSDLVEIGKIEPKAIEKARVVMEIPRTYSQKTLEYKLVAAEIRNACPPAEKGGSFEINQLTPVLAYDLRPPTGLKNGGNGAITIIPRNTGNLAANSVQLSVTTDAQGVTLDNNRATIGTLAPRTSAEPQTVMVQVPRTYTQAGLPIQINISQDGFTGITETKTIPLQIAQPQLQLIDQSNLGRQVIQGMIGAELVVAVTNRGDLAAENVELTIANPNELINFPRNKAVIGTLPPNSKSVPETFTFHVPGRVQPGAFPIQVTVTQKDFPPLTETLNYQIVARSPGVQEVKPQETPASTAPMTSNQSPAILVSEITDGQTVYTDHVAVTVSVSDSSGLASVKGSLNGGSFYNSQTDAGVHTGNKLLSFQRELTPLRPGENRIEIVATGTDNQSQTSTLTISYIPSAGNIVELLKPSDVDVKLPKGQPNPNAAALIIGIGTYQNIPVALYADRDAMAFQQYCVNTLGVSKGNVELLLNDKATLASIKKSLQQLSNRGPQIKTVFLFYSGHGCPSLDGKQRYLIPYDGDPVFLDDTCFAVEELYKRLEKLSAQDITMFIDACFSGKDRRANPILPAARPVLKVYDRTGQTLLATGKITQVASSEGDQISWSYDDKRHGLFTYYLLKGLQGEARDGSGKLTVGTLYEYLLQQIPAAANRLQKIVQTPEMTGRDRNKVLVRY